VKLSNWATRLDEYIAAAANMPFSYDRALGLDCCTFTWGAIHAQTGCMIGQRFAGTYSTKREALVAMKKYCGKASLGLFISKLMQEYGFEVLISPLYAQRGDAVLAPNGGEQFFGILDLNGRDVLSVGENGVRRVPISISCRAWRIA
jgi:cell wall-associated NlpC family hydrolase